MSSIRNPQQPHLELLQQLFGAATREASAAMCRWTNGLITLSLDEVCEMPLEQVCRSLDCGDELLTMIVLGLPGEIGGELILCFDEENGRQLAASLLGRKACQSPEWTELEKSALNETGNILGCAYLNALTRLIGLELFPTPPHFIQDYGASVLEQALMTQAMNSDMALIFRTGFHRQGEELNWRVFFIPTSGMRQHLEEIMCLTN
jgi:chemotaxis protein CheC